MEASTRSDLDGDQPVNSQMPDTRTPGIRWRGPFIALWTSQALSLIGSRIVQFAMVWWLTRETGSAAVLATATIAALLPEILAGPLAGVYVDRWDRRRVMLLADAMVGLISLGLAAAFHLGLARIWHIYGVMALRAIGGSFHWPAVQASTSLMVPEEELSRVAGMNQALNGALGIATPILGALLMEWLPMAGVMMVDVVTAAMAIGILFFLHVPRPEPAGTQKGGMTLIDDLRVGLKYIAAWPGMMILIGVVLLIKLALTPAFSLIPLLVKGHFGGGVIELGWFESVAGVGFVAGGLGLSLWGGFRRRIHTSLSGLVLLGLGLIALSLTPGGRLSLGMMWIFIIGAAIPLVDGPFMAIIQATVEPAIQGRVFTLIGSLVGLSSPLGLAVAGPVSDGLGVTTWFAIAGILSVICALVTFSVPAVIGIEDGRMPSLLAQSRRVS